MKTPDITKAQIAAFLTFVGGYAVAFGWITNTREQTLVAAGSTIFSFGLKLADAWIRHGRSKAAVAQLVEQLVMEKVAATAPATPAASS